MLTLDLNTSISKSVMVSSNEMVVELYGNGGNIFPSHCIKLIMPRFTDYNYEHLLVNS